MKKEGFTLRELLVVIAALALTALIGCSSFHQRACDASRVATLDNGRWIYKMVWPPEVESPLMVGSAAWKFPGTRSDFCEVFKNSTVFFAYLMATNRACGPAYSRFSDPACGVPAAGNSAEFLDGKLHNIWCITLDISDGTKLGTPLLFTQNFKFRATNVPPRVCDEVGLEKNARPFGDSFGIVINRGGGGLSLDNAQALIATNFNPTKAVNGFLWPLSSGQDLSMK